MKIRRVLKSNRGSSLILYCLLLSALCGFSALAVDCGVIIIEKAKMQNCADSAVLAGAQELPDLNKTAEIIEEYVIKNGYTMDDFTITFENDNNVVRVKANKQVDLYFARILGIDSVNNSVEAGAERDLDRPGSVPACFDYALFSGSNTSPLTLNGGTNVEGNSHTNAMFTANGTNTITGVCEAITRLKVNGASNDIQNQLCPADFIPMPDFSDMIKNQALAGGTYFNSSTTLSGNHVSIDSPIYVNGNLTLSGTFSGKGCIVASGSITFNGNVDYNVASDSICIYSRDGNITINGGCNELYGIVYAPNGRIVFNGTNQIVHGRVIGNVVTLNGGTDIRSSPNDVISLPSGIESPARPKSNSKLVK
ncbi:MAG: hypothetical protein GX660_09725 [Clostridiaceae bacterium]|nr:hypothetical protein [Clostridiaceae bacterium]